MKITDLNPKLIWQCFDEITQIPRPTHHLDKMRTFLVDWAKRHNIAVKTDEVGNVVMTKPATPGHENAPTIVLQGHQDMVAEKNGDSTHDFFNDPIQTIVEGDWVRANGTTLGADNGMGCAAGMAVLLDETLVHGPIECLFTVDEEQGPIGANGLQPGFITGKTLLNLDSEEHGQLVIGCAGGKVTTCTLAYKEEQAPENYTYFSIDIKNMKGGHSGMEIGLGRGNANQQLARFIWEMSQNTNVLISEFNGGGLANAIPREAKAIIGVPTDKVDYLKKFANEFDTTIHHEFELAENKDFTFSVEKCPAPDSIIEQNFASTLIAVIFSTPNGVQGMSNAIPGLIETSCNLASVKMIDNNKIEIVVHQRSSVDSRRDEIANRIKSLYQTIGATVEFGDAYVGWAPDPNSNVLKIAKQSFNELFNCEPRVEALHAGLECGLFLEKMPGLDMISFGPTLKDIHSPSEKANITSVADFWKLLTLIIEKLA